MKRIVIVCLALAACLCLAFPIRPQQGDFSKVQVKATPVAGNVYMLVGTGGNIGASIGPDGILIVDDQFAPLADKIRAELKRLSEGKLRFVLNTHWHGDHTGGNAVFGTEADIFAHTNVRKRLSVDAVLRGQKISAAPKQALPIVTYDNSISIHFNGEEIRVVHFPSGHTDGDSVIFFTGANVVHMGDDFFVGRFPFVDLESGGSVAGLISNVAELIAKLPADVKIIPGHGPLSSLDDLKTYQRMLTETTDIIRKRMAAGKTVEQAKAEGLPENFKSWGSGFIKTDQWIETIYKSYAPSGATGDKKHHHHSTNGYINHGH